MTIIMHERVGDKKYNKNGLLMEIVGYRKFNDVDVLFENGYLIKNIEYIQYKRGTLTNPYIPSVYTYGYLGEGIHKAGVNRKHTEQYIAWKSMLNRCYDEGFHKKRPTYIGCSVSLEWHNFQVFADWYNQNYYQFKEQNMQLDKDIIKKGNKVYSAETCVYVPQAINKLFMKRENCRGNAPIGVTPTKHNTYEAWCSDGSGDQVYLGVFNTPELAFSNYKIYKENLIKEIATSYQGMIPTRLFNAMMEYEVNISD